MPLSPARNPLIVGKRARFTIVHRNCIRIEDAPHGRFIDHPSLFAVNRDARDNGFTVTERDGAVDRRNAIGLDHQRHCRLVRFVEPGEGSVP